jgi:protoporphyrinogen oxidase
VANTRESAAQHFPVVVIGGGPAGLTAAQQLGAAGVRAIVLEASDKVGGLARTETYKGYRFDLGGHRFYTQVPEVLRLWEEMLGDDFIRVRRLSRIFYRGKYFHYPIEPLDTLKNLGLLESGLTFLSYVRARLFPSPVEENFEQWISNRFGRRLFRMFFKTYTEKVWGISCSQIHAEWAAQRIKGLSFLSAVWYSVFRNHNIKSLIHEFQYPRAGPGMMWECFRQAIERAGGQVWLNTPVIRLRCRGNRVTSVLTESQGNRIELTGDHFISSMPLMELILRLDPPPPSHVLNAARELKYRAFIIVELILNRRDVFPDNWIYIHSPDAKVGRIQNFKNWSAAMVPDPNKTSLGMEYFCNEDDELWRLSDVGLIALAVRDLELLNLARPEEVEDGVVLRQPKAYPVYDPNYRERLQVIRRYLDTFENLQTIGRNGMHRYNNQDHSMLTGILAARNVRGEKHDLWEVNTERSYYEEFIVDEGDM